MRNMEGVGVAPLQLYVSALVFSPQNSIIRNQFQREIPVSISRRPIVEQYWGALLHTLDDCDPYVVEFSPDGQLLATSLEETINLWDTTTWDLRKALRLTSPVCCVAFSPRENLLATGSEDGLVIFWDTAQWKEIYRQEYCEAIQSIAFSCDELFVAASEHNLWVSDIDLTKNRFSTEIDIRNIGATVRFSPCDKLLVATSREGIGIWETETWNLVRTLNYDAWAVSFSANGKHMGISTYDKTFVLETESWTVVSTEILGHRVLGVSFSRGGRLVAASSSSNSVEIVNAQECSSRTYIRGHGNSARGVSFSPTKDILASSADDETVKLWITPPDILSHPHQASPHWDYVFQVAFSPTGDYVASRAWGSDLIVWDAQTGKQEFYSWTGSNDDSILQFSLLEFSLDGQWLLCWGFDNPLKVWNIYTKELVIEDSDSW